MRAPLDDEEHKAWLAKNRHLLSPGAILALGEELTDKERAKFEAWYKARENGSSN